MRESAQFRVLQEVHRWVAKFGGSAHPTLQQISKGAGLDRDTVKTHIPALETAGYITVKHSTTRGVANEYGVTPHGMEVLARGGIAEAEFEAESRADFNSARKELLKNSEGTLSDKEREPRSSSEAELPQTASLRPAGSAPPQREKEYGAVRRCERCHYAGVLGPKFSTLGGIEDEGGVFLHHGHCAALFQDGHLRDDVHFCGVCSGPLDPDPFSPLGASRMLPNGSYVHAHCDPNEPSRLTASETYRFLFGHRSVSRLVSPPAMDF